MSPARKRILRLALRFTGLAVMAIALAPFYWPTIGFARLTSEPRVRYEPGAEAAAAIVARALPDAIAAIERAQLHPFPRPIEIFVCASTGSFERYGYGVRGAGGFVFNGRLFISPKPQNTPERLPRLLVHELSHLQLEQQMGFLRFVGDIPAWFKEGLAVYVSGAGAETVSPDEARDAITRDHCFQPFDRGSFLSAQIGGPEGLKPHLFYRESALFIEFMAQSEPSAFHQLLAGVEDRRDFAESVRRAYGRDVATLHREFVASVKKTRALSP